MNINLKKELIKIGNLEKNILMQWSLGKIPSFKHLLVAVGYNEPYISNTYFESERNRELTFHDLKEYFSDRVIEAKVKYFLYENPPVEITTSDLKKETPTITQQTDEKIVLRDCKMEKCFLYNFQKKAVKKILEKIEDKNSRGVALIAPAGYGKTFIMAAVIARLIENNALKGCVSPWPIFIVTKASVVEQTKRVFKKYYNLSYPTVHIINIDQLRSKAGELFVNEKIVIDHGQEHIVYEWRPMIHPKFIFWDECHTLKNHGSQQHQIAASANELDDVWQVFVSATPGVKVDDFKCFACSTRVTTNLVGITDAPLTNERWSIFAKNISAPSAPNEYCPAAVDRLMDALDDFIVRVQGVKPQFKAINKVEIIDFITPEGKEHYEKALLKLEEKTAKLKSKHDEGLLSAGHYKMGVLTAMLYYRMAAESNPDRVKYLCDNMLRLVKSGKAAFCAANFRITIHKCVEYMVYELGISRDHISLIWGGGVAGPTDKQKAKAAFENDTALMEALTKAGLTLKDISLDDVEAAEVKEVDPNLRLGMQSLKERQKEIDRFQSGKSYFCFYIFKSGGVGLSLHHSDELSEFKVRHKESGYAYVEDIPSVTTRPREGYVAPTWSPIELVQGLGRAPRITSLSDTIQHLVFFKGTIEERVAELVSKGLRCLTKVVRQTESWEQMIIDHNYKPPTVEVEEDEDDSVLYGTSSGEDEE